MIKKNLIVGNPAGLHVRPSGRLCRLTEKFECKISISNGEYTVNGKSMLSVISAKIKGGDTLLVTCDGADEAEAMEQIADFLKNDKTIA